MCLCVCGVWATVSRVFHRHLIENNSSVSATHAVNERETRMSVATFSLFYRPYTDLFRPPTARLCHACDIFLFFPHIHFLLASNTWMTSMTVKRRFSALNEGVLVAGERERERLQKETASQTHTHTRWEAKQVLSFLSFYVCVWQLYLCVCGPSQKKCKKARRWNLKDISRTVFRCVCVCH